jgi:nitrogen fixation-related uncharacterized protein
MEKHLIFELLLRISFFLVGLGILYFLWFLFKKAVTKS